MGGGADETDEVNGLLLQPPSIGTKRTTVKDTGRHNWAIGMISSQKVVVTLRGLGGKRKGDTIDAWGHPLPYCAAANDHKNGCQLGPAVRISLSLTGLP